MKTMIAVLVLMVAAVVGVAWLLRAGVSVRGEPSALETFVARQLRHLAIPAKARETPNPLAPSPEVIAEGLGHFADHCAICHANDGSGDTEIGRRLYPKAPDMRKDDTQSLSDGELFAIISNGVRFTGMPAWGSDDPDEDKDGWELVHFIRHLPSLKPQELEEMKRLNPQSPQEVEEDNEERELQQGQEAAKQAAPIQATPMQATPIQQPTLKQPTPD